MPCLFNIRFRFYNINIIGRRKQEVNNKNETEIFKNSSVVFRLQSTLYILNVKEVNKMFSKDKKTIDSI